MRYSAACHPTWWFSDQNCIGPSHPAKMGHGQKDCIEQANPLGLPLFFRRHLAVRWRGAISTILDIFSIVNIVNIFHIFSQRPPGWEKKRGTLVTAEITSSLTAWRSNGESQYLLGKEWKWHFESPYLSFNIWIFSFLWTHPEADVYLCRSQPMVASPKSMPSLWELIFCT